MNYKYFMDDAGKEKVTMKVACLMTDVQGALGSTVENLDEAEESWD
jgi:hypothetical protein